MRISELCLLKFDCLRQDAEGDWFLQYEQFKMKQEHIIPISKELAQVIQEQQQYIRENLGANFAYLFCDRQWTEVGARNLNRNILSIFVPVPKPIKGDSLAKVLNVLAYEKNICTSSGRRWRFQSHQFRHTVGTRMVNMGVPLHIIQKYLGHISPEMTLTYAYIHDSTMKQEIAKFYGKVVNISGQIVHSQDPEVSTAELQWFKRNVLGQALPNGSCALPLIAGACPHANACLTCSHFRTTVEFLNQHKEQLQQTEQLIEKAKANNWIRQAEMNQQVASHLNNIINSLQTQ